MFKIIRAKLVPIKNSEILLKTSITHVLSYAFKREISCQIPASAVTKLLNYNECCQLPNDFTPQGVTRNVFE